MGRVIDELEFGWQAGIWKTPAGWLEDSGLSGVVTVQEIVAHLGTDALAPADVFGHALRETMAQELACEKIRGNAIAPGAIKTAINRDAWEDEEARKELLKLIPYGRIGETEDVAEAAVWLASDASDYVVGTTLFVDGGMMLYPAFREGG